MYQFLSRTSVCFAIAATAAFAQAPAAPLAFEVVTIRPAPPLNPQAMMGGQVRIGMSVDGDRVDIRLFSVADLIRTAYKVKQFQLGGVDSGFAADRFDVQAKMPPGKTKDDVPEMLKTMLAERFKLKIRQDSKEQNVYALVVGKGGVKMKESEPDKPVDPDAPKTPSNVMSVQQDGKGATIKTGQGNMRMTPSPNGTMHMETDKMTMEAMSEMLSQFMDRPVVDMTELKGNYQVGLDISMDEMMNAARKAGMAIPPGAGRGGAGGAVPEAADPTGSIFNAVQALGLKLEPRKHPMPLIVVEHVEKTPTEN